MHTKAYATHIQISSVLLVPKDIQIESISSFI